MVRTFQRVLLSFIALFAMPAAAASFDCSKAVRPIDKLICTFEDDLQVRPSLSHLDEEMARAFAEKRAKLGPAEVRDLLAEQRAWLKSRESKCDVPTSGEFRDEILSAFCVADLYRKRIADLRRSWEDEEILTLFSADDDLCPRVTGALNHVHRQFPHAVSLRDFADPLGITSRREAADFLQFGGFSAPPWLKRGDPAISAAEPSFVYAFWADFNDGKRRLVYLQERCFSNCEAFNTGLWIFNAGEQFSVVPDKRLEPWDGVDPSKVALAFTFTRYGDELYPMVTGGHSLSTPNSPNLPDYASYFINRWTRGAPQDPFLYNGEYYVVGGAPLIVGGFVYKLRPNLSASVVCVVAPRNMSMRVQEENLKSRNERQ